jgi:hypothetical protein
VVNTAWAMMALMAAGWHERDPAPLHRWGGAFGREGGLCGVVVGGGVVGWEGGLCGEGGGAEGIRAPTLPLDSSLFLLPEPANPPNTSSTLQNLQNLP